MKQGGRRKKQREEAKRLRMWGEAAKSNILSSIGSVTETIKEKLTMPKDKVEQKVEEDDVKASDQLGEEGRGKMWS
ncbi:hypothetical protein AAC387_Pa11g1041 [Persea americana]